jgi:hypothetical protein
LFVRVPHDTAKLRLAPDSVVYRSPVGAIVILVALETLARDLLQGGRIYW